MKDRWTRRGVRDEGRRERTFERCKTGRTGKN